MDKNEIFVALHGKLNNKFLNIVIVERFQDYPSALKHVVHLFNTPHGDDSEVFVETYTKNDVLNGVEGIFGQYLNCRLTSLEIDAFAVWLISDESKFVRECEEDER